MGINYFETSMLTAVVVNSCEYSEAKKCGTNLKPRQVKNAKWVHELCGEYRGSEYQKKPLKLRHIVFSYKVVSIRLSFVGIGAIVKC